MANPCWPISMPWCCPGGAEQPRDLPVPGRDLNGACISPWNSCRNRTRSWRGCGTQADRMATGKHVVVIGGGDTGSDCVGTSNRHGAASVTQFDCSATAGNGKQTAGGGPLADQNAHVLARRLRSAIGRLPPRRFWAKRQGRRLQAVRLKWEAGKMAEVAGSEFEIEADLVLLAMGFTGPGSRASRAIRRRP